MPAFVELFYKMIWSNAKESHKDKALKAMMVISNGLRKVGIDLRIKFFKSIHDAFGGNLRKIVTPNVSMDLSIFVIIKRILISGRKGTIYFFEIIL